MNCLVVLVCLLHLGSFTLGKSVILCTNHQYLDGKSDDVLVIDNVNTPIKTKPSQICVHTWPDVGHAAEPSSCTVLVSYNFSDYQKSNITVFVYDDYWGDFTKVVGTVKASKSPIGVLNVTTGGRFAIEIRQPQPHEVFNVTLSYKSHGHQFSASFKLFLALSISIALLLLSMCTLRIFQLRHIYYTQKSYKAPEHPFEPSPRETWAMRIIVPCLVILVSIILFS